MVDSDPRLNTWQLAGAGKRQAGGQPARCVFAYYWGSLRVAIKVPPESCDVSNDEARSLLQYEEEVYRRMCSHVEGSAGPTGIDRLPL